MAEKQDILKEGMTIIQDSLKCSLTTYRLLAYCILQMSAKGLKITEGQSSLEIPPTVFSQLNSTVTAVTVFFSTLGHVLTSTKAHGRLSTSLGTDSHWTLNSILASVTIRPAPPDVISTPFNIALEAKKVPEVDYCTALPSNTSLILRSQNYHNVTDNQ